MSDVAESAVIVAAAVPKSTAVAPPRFVPVIVIVAPQRTAPLTGLIDVIVGAGAMVDAVTVSIALSWDGANVSSPKYVAATSSDPAGASDAWHDAVPPTNGAVHNRKFPIVNMTLPVGVPPLPETVAESVTGVLCGCGNDGTEMVTTLFETMGSTSNIPRRVYVPAGAFGSLGTAR